MSRSSLDGLPPSHVLRRFVRSSPFLYKAVKCTQQFFGIAGTHFSLDQLCSSGTSLCIEGYPSSGNSYLVNIARRAFGDSRISSHTHSIANLKLAQIHDVPLLVPVRAPAEAISSRVVRFSVEDRIALAEYVEFHGYVASLEDKEVCLLSFETLTQDLRQVTRIIQSLVQSGRVAPPKAVNEKVIRADMEEWGDDHPEQPLGLPNSRREREKSGVRERLLGTDQFRTSQLLYHDLMTRCL